MRRRESLIVVLVALIAVACLLSGSRVEAQSNKPVKVKVNCPKQEDGKFTISVDPMTVEVSQGQGVEWSLDIDDKKNEYIEIAAKDPSAWLYVDLEVKGNKEAVMTQMKEGSAGNTYDYNISIWCGEDMQPIVLDPRIKVGGG